MSGMTPTDKWNEMQIDDAPGAPRWVKVSAIVALVVIVVALVMMLAGGGNHGPGRHASSAAAMPAAGAPAP